LSFDVQRNRLGRAGSQTEADRAIALAKADQLSALKNQPHTSANPSGAPDFLAKAASHRKKFPISLLLDAKVFEQANH
jgi:hypothetical protein